MCNLIKHAGQGCVITNVVDLYKTSKYNQNAIINITRKMRDEEREDFEIIQFLGLREKVHFKMDRNYLQKLYGFITSRTSLKEDMYFKWLIYHKEHRGRIINS